MSLETDVLVEIVLQIFFLQGMSLQSFFGRIFRDNFWWGNFLNNFLGRVFSSDFLFVDLSFFFGRQGFFQILVGRGFLWNLFGRYFHSKFVW